MEAGTENDCSSYSSCFVNRGGFPIDETTWEKMWDHVAKVHPHKHETMGQIRGNTALKHIAIPQPPHLTEFTTVAAKVQAIQSYLKEFQYNHTGTQFFEMKKGRCLSRMMEQAKEMIKVALPIKCLEAVILGLYLTCGLYSVTRFVIGFKTKCEGHYHKHVVLGVYYEGLFGCVGLSRREDLMYKPLVYQSLYELVCDFQTSYKQYYHTVVRVKLSLPVVHDFCSGEKICWGYLKIELQGMANNEIKRLLERYSREMKTKVRIPLLHSGASPTEDLSSGSSNGFKPASQTKSAYKVQV
ncbi:tubulinyl-Tyr carboxypeptidase 2-like isoform X2 [Corticium candelabrum]|uniref:tubulinyl-Tyr carboxypeptidase 2-like isoform X2 n=1 Tax=Corticium candelabrum TaxID=121492 RepID=UPI002E258BAD|nr:tubulinyl-Tyr carboxypeptidase 2-like isoform X2 [Corticium candelabrum]